MRSAFGYVRVSSQGQAAEHRDGLKRQKLAITKYAEANGFRIVRWFSDSISGTTDLDHRPALLELIAAANGVRVIVIEKLDRLARDLMISESILKDLQRHGFELISTMEPDLCSTEPTRILIRQILSAFSAYEKSMIVLKLTAAKQRARATNPQYREGRPPFGDGAYPNEAATVTMVLDLYAKGMTQPAICAALTAEGHNPRNGGFWFPTHIGRIIKRAKTQPN